MQKTAWMVFVFLTFCAAVASADESINPDKPFAERHVLLQVSDNDPAKFNLALDIANNLIRHYGSADVIDIQIVTFAGGIQMLTEGTPADKARIASMMDSDIRFYICLNTLDTMARTTGKRPEVLPGVLGVQTGVAHMLDQIALGYVPIRP